MSLSKTQQKKEKLKELVWYICKNYNNQLFETKLWKLAFFCDADYFQKYGTLLTSVPYIKNKYGPTPVHSIAEQSIKELISNGFIVKSENNTFVAIKDYELKNLDSHQIDAINTTCDKYFKLTTDEICTLAHRDPVYLSAEKFNDILDFSFVAYRDDGATNKEDEDDKLPKTISFNKKAQDNLLKMAMA